MGNAEHKQSGSTLCELTRSLRADGERTMSGESSVELATSVLVGLNKWFRMISEDDLTSSFEAVPGNVLRLPENFQRTQFVYDIVQKVIRLKLIHQGQTIVGSISLSPFRNLQELELMRVPLHLLTGLDKQRPKLEMITVLRSVTTLKEIFETCGADQASASTWPELHTITMQFNMIETLDTSLRLLPVLRTCNLSHNKIHNTEGCLEYLTELATINLSNNCLKAMPSFAYSCRITLRSVNLSTNYLEHIDGVQQLTCLEMLDVSNNCICDHNYLQPLNGLKKLRRLCLSGNPVCFHKMHRIRTVEQLHFQVISKIELDGKKLTEQEKSYSSRYTRTGTRTRDHVDLSPSQRLLINEAESERDGYSSLEQSYNPGYQASGSGTGTLDDTTEDIDSSDVSRKKKGKGKGKKSKRRIPEISDMEAEVLRATEKFKWVEVPEAPEGAVVEGPLLKHELVQREVQQMRSQLGPAWLSSVGDRFNTANESEASSKPTNQEAGAKGGATNQSPVSFKSVGGEDNEDNVSFKSLEPTPVTTLDDYYLKGSVGREPSPLYNDGYNSELSEKKRSLTDMEKSERESNSLEKQRKYSFDGQTQGKGRKGSMDSKKQRKGSTTSQTQERNGSTDAEKQERRKLERARSIEERVLSPSIYGKNSAPVEKEVDYGLESESFIVYIYREPGASLANSDNDDDNPEYMITITDRYVLQKDLNADVVAELDLYGLLSAKLVDGIVMTDDEKSMYSLFGADATSLCVVHLQFDSVRKDKRERRFVMEDRENAEAFLELLEPTLQRREEEGKYKDRYQCLKCDEEFGKNQAIVPMQTMQGEPTEGIFCPKCESNIVIELDPTQLEAAGKGQVQIPAKSLDTGALKPLATSSTPTTTSYRVTSAADQISEQARKVSEFLLATSTSVTRPVFRLPAESEDAQNNMMKKSTSGAGLSDVTNSPQQRYLRKNFSMQEFYTPHGEEFGRGEFGRGPPVTRTVTVTGADHRSASGYTSYTSSQSSTSTFTSSHTLVGATGSSDVFVRESGSDLVVLENPGANPGVTGVTGVSRVAVGLADGSLGKDAVIRESGSDLYILQNPKVKTLQESLKGSKHLERKGVVRESGSDLLILSNPSAAKVGQSSQREMAAEKHARTRSDGGYRAQKMYRRKSSEILVLEESSQDTEEDSTAEQSTQGQEHAENSIRGAVEYSRSATMPNFSSEISTQPKHSTPFTEYSTTTRTENPATTLSPPAHTTSSLETSMSPCGSLTERTVSAMVNHMYWSVYEGTDTAPGTTDTDDGIEVISSSVGTPGIYPSVGFIVGSMPDHKELEEDDFSSGTPHSFRSVEDRFGLGSPKPVRGSDVVSESSARGESAAAASPGGGNFYQGGGSFASSVPRDVSSLSIPRGGFTSSENRSSGSSDIHAVPVESSESTREAGITYNYNDYTQVDHRLKLYFDIHLFSEDAEEFQLIIKCPMVQHSRGEERMCLLVASSSKLYFIDFTDTTASAKAEHPEDWLKLQQALPLIDLRYVDIGPSYQSLRLEFDSPTATYTLMMRDAMRCQMFVAQFTGILQDSSFSAHSQLQGIMKNSDITLHTLFTLRLSCLKEGVDEDEQEVVDDSDCKVFLCYLRSGAADSEGGDPVTLLLTPGHVCLAHDNLHVLPSFCQPDKLSAQYMHKDRQKLQDVTSVDVYSQYPTEATIHFTDERSNEEVTWSVVMETGNALLSLVNILRESYTAIFGVDLDVIQIDTEM